MVKTLHLSTEIPDSRQVVLELPLEVPTGHAEIIVQVTTGEDTSRASTAGSLLRSRYVGIWKDRTDIEDGVEFAAELRRKVWERPIE